MQDIAKEEMKELQASVIESFNPDKSHLDIKSQITIINKLAKDELYREAN